MSGLLATFDDQIRPDRAALLIVDLQNDFCAPGGFMQKERGYNVEFAKTVAANIEPALAAARAAGMLVVWVRSIYDFKYLAAPHVVKRVKEGCCLEGSWGADFFMLEPRAGEPIVDKHHYSGFVGTRLDEILRQHRIETLILVGVATNVCVDSTLRDGFFRGYYIVLLEDCVGSNSAAGHAGTLATVRNNIGVVTTSAAWIEMLRSRWPRPDDRAALA
ncbi:MAG TPA: cysteine hydrolase [Alphaproteobacteria bacterium]|nr:cysteine hydrolase [Alphaproteobacteria bacterium]